MANNVSGKPKTNPTNGIEPIKQDREANTVIIAASGARTVLANAAQIETLPNCDSVMGVDINHAAILAEKAVTNGRIK